MRCDNSFCIYKKDGLCSLDRIDLDEAGRCRQCIEVQWTQEELEEKKEKLRLSLST